MTVNAKVVDNNLLTSLCNQRNDANVIGVALSPKNDEALYCEFHMRSVDSNRVVVEYWDFSPALIAKKELNFSSGLVTPSVVQEDFRHGEKRSVQKQDAEIALSYTKPNANKSKITSLPLEKFPENAIVVDAGFDEKLRQNWEALINGEVKSFDFVSPVHGRAINLTVSHKVGKKCGGHEYDQDRLACFLIDPTNDWLKLFSKPLALLYDNTNRRLVVFSGAVNVTSDQGKSQSAVIHYYYKNDSSAENTKVGM